MPVGGMVISFDFELLWGTRRSSRDAARYRDIVRVREVVSGILAIFERYDIPATWATVGALFIRPEDCVAGRYPFDQLPPPGHSWFEGGWYEHVPPVDGPDAGQYYAPDLIEKLLACRATQELGTHTFSHVVMSDVTAEVARAELARAQALAARWGIHLDSVVFPRNQAGHLPILEETGYTNYRAINSEWYWLGVPHRIGTPLGAAWPWRQLRRATLPLRFLDEYARLTPPTPPARRVGKLWEIPHSMFFPGYSGVSKYISPDARWQRALRGMRRAAEQGRIFSIYTHPHNFLPDIPRLLGPFERICQEAARLRDAGKLEITTMGDIARDLSAGKNLHWADAAAQRAAAATSVA